MQIVEQQYGVRASARGWQIASARLSLDGDTRQRVGFIADFDGKRRIRSRALCSAGVAAALPGAGGCLTPPWGKPFQLGKLAVALLAAGSSPGAAMLRLHLNGQTILDARHFAALALPGTPPAEFREAQGILLDASAGHLSAASPADLQQWLLDLSARLADGPMQLTVDDAFLGAWAAHWLVAQRPEVSLQLSAPLRRAWNWLSPEAPAPRRSGRPNALRLQVAMRQGGAAEDLQWALHDPLLAPPAAAERALAFRRTAVGAQIDTAIAQTGATWALLQDDAEDHPGASALAERLEKLGVQTWLLRPARQMQLV